MPKSPRIVAIIAAYNEADIIGLVVGALIADGISVYVIDHQSTDGTSAEIEPYLERGVIGIERFPSETVAQQHPSDRFLWEALLHRKEALAAELDADWFIHHDADEFRESPWAGETLQGAIERVDRAGYNAVDFHVLNFCPTTSDPADVEDIRERMLFYEPTDEWDRLQIKCWKRTGHPVDLTTTGGHEARFPDRRVFPIRFLSRHYPIRSQAHGERKVFHERKPRFLASERKRGWHIQYDAIHEGANFVRGESSLIRFDGGAVRLELCVHHREFEALEAELIPLRRLVEERQSELTALRQHLASQTAELDRLRPVVAAQETQLDELRRHVAEQDAELARLRVVQDQLVERQSQLERLQADLARDRELLNQTRGEITLREVEISSLRDRLAAEQRRVADLLTSRSWRLTAPLRAAQRLITGK
jgi:hypothetical protein